ncbi:MAG TPA: glycosyltransferase family 4 protein, partial [Patescibacteria group bacterium]|nr:glycosyltransferase family 4 protein [Patescibacteria group bacterium]
ELFFLMSQAGGHDIEGFGLVFLEAAASGLPTIGSKDCGAEDAILDGKNGFLVDAKDIGGFSDAIKKILGDANLKKKMSEESRKFAGASGWDRRTEEYVQIYQTLLKPPKTK